MAVLFAVAACNEAATEQAAPRTWVYPPSHAAWPLGRVTGTIGRSQAPDVALAEGITGPAPLQPLRLPTPWAVPGDGPARAIIYGLAGTTHAIELIDIDAGRVVWRDTTACGGPVVGVTAQAVVCADAKGVRAVGLDGKPRWKNDATFIALTDDRVITARAGESVVLDADIGDEVARVKLPPAVPSDSILASCGDAGRELFAYGQDGRLVHVVEAAGGPKAAWSVPLSTIAGIDACEGENILVTTSNATGTSLVSIARSTGAITGSLDGVRGYWPARDGSARLEVSTGAGVMLHTRDLAGPSEPVGLPSLAELLSKRGDRRLVRATPATAVLLDRKGVRAYLPLAQLGAVLGDQAVVAGSWLGSPGETVRRIPIPGRYRRVLRVPPMGPAVAVPAELRDLPGVIELDATRAIAKLDTGKSAVAAVAFDPQQPAVYATALEHEPDDATSAGVARFELKTKTWSWYRSDGCGPGTPVALAVAQNLVACAARSSKGGSVHATTREGGPLWTWQGDNVDSIDAAGDVVLVRDADRLHLLDGRDGTLLGDFTSDDGAAMPAALLDIAGMTMLVTAERGRVMARLPRVQMAPAWTLAVAGVVHALSPAGDGVLVDLEDGDAYRIDALTGVAVSIPGLDLVWRTSGELITGEAPGGPVPPATLPAPPPPPKLPATGKKQVRPADADPMAEPPTLPRTWPAPPPMPASWQYTLYEVTGAFRARNDYALDAPITPARARMAGAPLVVQSGPGLRDLLVIDPERGDPRRRIRLPEDAAPGTAFSTIIDGKPVVGTLLADPLRVVLF